ncbi:MAG: ABC transporter ATP-binding protein [Clostridia bacterium]|nr:ABC transporter ATP-binding protein [Clostridia bacterium]
MAELILDNVRYRYRRSKRWVLDGCNAVFSAGTVSSIRGRSGAGKSTLLHLIAGFDSAPEGKILWDGQELQKSRLTEYRRHEAGIVSQSFLLFQTRTVLENVCYPLELGDLDRAKARTEARACLEAVGLSEELYHRLPGRLSGGEQQRVAIARCLAGKYPLIVADEPTGNLDEENAHAIMALLIALSRERNATVIVVTHDSEIAEKADEKYRLVSGILSKL